MSDSSKPLTKHDIAAYLITAPFTAIEQGFSLAAKAGRNLISQSKDKEDASKPRPIPQSSQPLVTANPVFIKADRVWSTLVRETKLSFYLYANAKEIRVNATRGSLKKQIVFTPQIASSQGLHFNFDGALIWVKTKGFVDAPAPAPAPVLSPKVESPGPVADDSKPQSKKEFSKQSSAKPRVADSSYKTKPYFGTIVSLGAVVKPGMNGKPAYETFALKLDLNGGSFQKEFIGEHLAELAEELGLSVGNQIKIVSLGKTFFTVIVEGKEEERNRNGYEIEVLAK